MSRFFAKEPNHKAFPILFNDNRFCDGLEMDVEKFACSLPVISFIERTQGVHFSLKRCAPLIIPLRTKNKAAKSVQSRRRTILRPYEDLHHSFGAEITDGNEAGKLLEEELRQREEIDELILAEACTEMTCQLRGCLHCRGRSAASALCPRLWFL